MRRKNSLTIIKRYREEEKGEPLKKVHADNRVVLIYPNTYFVGMGNLGFHALFTLLNNRPDTFCDRAFWKLGRPTSLHTRESVSRFPIMAFTFSYELDYPNFIHILTESGVPRESKDRKEGHPLVFAGGICVTLNPEPLADFVDLFVIGEAEEVIHEIMDMYRTIKHYPRSKILTALGTIEGVYVPRSHGTTGTIRRRVATRFNDFMVCSRFVTPHTEFGNRFLIQIGRGCGKQCRFCIGDYGYRYPRTWSLDKVLGEIKRGMNFTRRIGLVGSAIADYPLIDKLCHELEVLGADVSTSSLRLDSVREPLLGLLANSGQRGITCAPEAGSDRLRKIINKPLSDDDMIALIHRIKEYGFKTMKLYFMIGLPTETHDDMKALVELTKEVSTILPVTVNITPFIPKPHTPFQWLGMENRKSLNDKLAYVRGAIGRLKRSTFKAESIRKSVFESLLSRGNAQTGHALLLEDADKRSLYHEATRTFGLDEALPWDHIDSGVTKAYLEREYRNALREVTTPHCVPEKCRVCGMCGK